MMFIRFADYLGMHIPSLGAFLVSLIVVALLCLIASKLARRAANKRWTYDVEHRGDIIGQDIRERWEKKLAILEDRDKLRQAKTEDTLVALFKVMNDLTEYFKERR